MLLLNNLTTADHLHWGSQVRSLACRRLCIVTSGYEDRAKYWTEKSLPSIPAVPSAEWLVIGFADYRNVLHRPANDAFYRQAGLVSQDFSSREDEPVIDCIRNTIANHVATAGEEHVELNVDYSCMPRLWYCKIVEIAESLLRPTDTAYFWYSAGRYHGEEYPTAGVEDFRVFAGRATLSPRFRTHLLGLGFDKIRSHAILSVLDPQNLVCFYADPGVSEQHVAKVEADNSDILSQASHCFRVPLPDFVYTFSKLCAVVRDFRKKGDVILVPDGPKPIILASSLVPLCISNVGIVSFHVLRRKSPEFTPVDVTATGSVYGFSISGAAKS